MKCIDTAQETICLLNCFVYFKKRGSEIRVERGAKMTQCNQGILIEPLSAWICPSGTVDYFSSGFSQVVRFGPLYKSWFLEKGKLKEMCNGRLVKEMCNGRLVREMCNGRRRPGERAGCKRPVGVLRGGGGMPKGGPWGCRAKNGEVPRAPLSAPTLPGAVACGPRLLPLRHFCSCSQSRFVLHSGAESEGKSSFKVNFSV